MTPAELAHLALALTPGIGRARFHRLEKAFGSAADALAATHKDLAAIPRMSAAAATAVRHASLATAERAVERAHALGGAVLLPHDPRFPKALRQIPEAPLALFVVGRLELLDGPTVAIVGSRHHTRYGADCCRHFAAGLARAGLVVSSGMARGLDAVAHSAALDADGGTAGVLGNGLGVVYPTANRRLYDRMAREGCLLTEFPPGERPHAGSFPRRNRLISGLAVCTLVVEAGRKSGALITVDCALDQGREVLAVPGPITSPVSVGCNRLLQAGAKPALDLQDVLEEYALEPEPVGEVRVPGDVSRQERRVLAALTAGAEHADEVARRLDAAPGETLALLTALELRGLVTQVPGKVFRVAGALG